MNVLGFTARETETRASYCHVYLFMVQSRDIRSSEVSAGYLSYLSWIISSYYIPKEDYILALAIWGGTKAYFKLVPSLKGEKIFFLMKANPLVMGNPILKDCMVCQIF